MENPKVSLIIPTYDHWELTHRLLYDIFKYCHGDLYEVVCLDNGSTANEVVNGCEWWKKIDLIPFSYNRLEKNIGFVKAANLGMEMLTGDIKILLSNDVHFRSSVIPRIVSLLSANSLTLVGGVLRDYDTGWNRFGDRLFPYLEGWLLAMWGFAWKDLGGFDPRFSPYDYEDVDFSTTAISKGYTLAPLNDGGIIHICAQTIGYNEARLEQTAKNREKFEEKWIKK